MQSFLKANKLGKYNEEEMRRLEEEKEKQDREEEEEANKIKVGERCEARVPGNMARRGTVKFVGKTHFKPGEEQKLPSAFTMHQVTGVWCQSPSKF